MRLLRAVISTLAMVFILGNLPTDDPRPVWNDPVRASEIEAAYREIQKGVGLDNDARVGAAIECYLAAKARGYTLGRPVDIRFLVECATEPGRSLYDYELGRQSYEILCWQHTGLVCTDCDHDLASMSVSYRSGVAICEAKVTSRLAFAHDDEPLLSIVQHTFEVVLGQDGFWRLSSDSYRDEFRDSYPPGTDFPALAQSLTTRYDSWLKVQYPSETQGTRRSLPTALASFAAIILLFMGVLLARRYRKHRHQ